MKKFLTLLFTVILFSFSALAFAGSHQQAAADASSVNRDTRSFSERLTERLNGGEKAEIKSARQTAKLENMPKVAVMYINNSQTTYNNDIDQSILKNLAKAVDCNTYQYIDGKTYIDSLNKIGIADITTAERADIINVFKGDDIDYAIFLQVDPFIRKDKVTIFTVGKEMTAIVPFKIIDVKNNRYIYNGKFTEMAEDGSVFGDVGSKSVALKALEKVNEKAASIIDTRLPKTKDAAHK